MTQFSQKGNCQDCLSYEDYPRMQGGERCYSSPGRKNRSHTEGESFEEDLNKSQSVDPGVFNQ